MIRKVIQLARHWRSLVVMVAAQAVILAGVAMIQGLDLGSVITLVVCFALGVGSLAVPSRWREESE